jgi:hypothetical protein
MLGQFSQSTAELQNRTNQRDNLESSKIRLDSEVKTMMCTHIYSRKTELQS